MKCIFTNRTIGITFFSIGTNPTIGTNGLSELTNRIRLCMLDMAGRFAESRLFQLFLKQTEGLTQVDNSSESQDLKTPSSKQVLQYHH